MENIKEFMELLKKELMENLPEELTADMDISDAQITKINDQHLYGLCFHRGGRDSAPTIYVNQMYERYQDGESLRSLAQEMSDMYLSSLSGKEPVMPDLSFEKIKDNLTIRLVEMKRNRDYLADIPYMSLGNGLAAVCDIKLNDDREGIWRTTVTKQLMESQSYDKTALFHRAMEMSRTVDPPFLVSMGSTLFGPENRGNILESDEVIEEHEKEPMYVLSNASGVLGASTLFYPGMQDQIAEKLGEGYYALPSSLHEYLIVPESAGIDAKELADMVKTANRTVVEPKDVLSDTVLHYDRDERKLDSLAHNLSMDAKQAEARC